MKGARVLTAVAACAAMGASAMLHAQARGPTARGVRGTEIQAEMPPLVLDEATQARMIAEMEAWLGRVVGRFQIEGELVSGVRRENLSGTALCSKIGAGPGVRCVIRVVRPPPWIPAYAVSGTASQPRAPYTEILPVLYFGINPDTLEIQLLIVDSEQVAADAGVLAGDAIKFSDNWNVCHEILNVCWVASEMIAKPAGEIFIKIHRDHWSDGRKSPISTKSGHTNDIELHLHRESPQQPAASSACCSWLPTP